MGLTSYMNIRLELVNQTLPGLFIFIRDCVHLSDADINHAFRGEPCYANTKR